MNRRGPHEVGTATRAITARRRPAFSLAELLTVVAIMALLIGIALPAFRAARVSAYNTATQSLISSTLSQGLAAYRGEQALGGQFPPSASDGTGAYLGRVENPVTQMVVDNSVVTITGQAAITGASLLVYALCGADNQGTVGFPARSGQWAAALGGPGTGGLYDPAVTPAPAVYGPFVEQSALDSIKSMAEPRSGATRWLINKGSVQTGGTINSVDVVQRVFVDKFDRPILYYRARKAARVMVTQPGSAVGVYDHRDNAYITGGLAADGSTPTGLRMQSKSISHPLATVEYATNMQQAIDEPATFDSIIYDRASAARMRPVNPDGFLLISAGRDGLYGTADDIKNWGN